MVNCFDIFAISEHRLFEKQLDIFDCCTDLSYKWTAVSSKDNPPTLSGKPAHGGVALFWKISVDDLVTPFENIDSDHIIGICCDFPDSDPLFILSVYLPVLNPPIDEFNACPDYLWALYESLDSKVFVVVMDDCNGDLGNVLGDRGHYDPNVRGLKLIEFANFFNLCPVNLLANSSGPLETFVSHYGRYKSTIDYIFLPNCLSDKIVSCKTFENSIDNTSDHLPIKL